MRAVPEHFLDLAERLADAARGVIAPYFRQRLDIERKQDRSPVTAADREAEAAMRDLIAAAHPDHGIIGEEYGAERAGADHVWVLDPLDGTKNFVAGNPLFGTLIALTHHGRPILGLIDMPVLDERWSAAAGRPTTHRDRSGTRPASVRACPGPERAILCASSPHMFEGGEFAAFERLRTRSDQSIYGCECYAYGLLASGFVDLVVEADMGVHDFLPLAPVVEGAGGVMTDWQGAPLDLDSGGRVIAAGDRRCHESALGLLNGG